MVAKSEFDLLIKCLNMATSDNDGTALAAIRAANKQLAKLGWTWEKLLSGKVKVIEDPFGERVAAPPPPPPPRPAPPADPIWDDPWRDPDPVPRQTRFRADPPPRSGFRSGGTTTGRASSNQGFKPKASRPRKQSAGNITLDDLGL